MFDEAITAYQLGLFHSTIALCSMAAERICYDYLDLSIMTIRNKVLNQEAKEELYFTPFSYLIDFLYRAGVIEQDTMKVLLKINNVRNEHVHPITTSGAEGDSGPLAIL